MRVAALFDVHGNLPALEAALEDVERTGVDAVVAGGDVLWGPFQSECIGRLRDVGARFVAGNCERDVLDPKSEADGWCLRRLDRREIAFVSSWPLTLTLDVDGMGEVLFCHATPHDDEEIVTRLTPADDVVTVLAGVQADVVVCGHTHVQFERREAGAPRLVNAGSVGLAYEREPAAYWALLGPKVDLRRTAYDTESAAARIVASGFPGAHDVFGPALRGDVSPEDATAHFESLRGT